MTDQRAVLWIGEIAFPVSYLVLRGTAVTVHTSGLRGDRAYGTAFGRLSGGDVDAVIQTTIDGAERMPVRLTIDVHVLDRNGETVYVLKCDGVRLDGEVEIRE